MAPLGTLLWLGWRLLEQDRLLEGQPGRGVGMIHSIPAIQDLQMKTTGFHHIHLDVQQILQVR